MPDQPRPPQYLSLADFERQVRALFPHVEWEGFWASGSDDALSARSDTVSIVWHPSTTGENWTVFIDPSETLEQAVEAARGFYLGPQ